MRFTFSCLALALVLGAGGCRKEQPPLQEGAAAAGNEAPQAAARRGLEQGEGQVMPEQGKLTEQELKRRELVAAELAKVNPYPVKSSVVGLPEAEQAMVRELLAAARVVDRLNALQITARNDEYAREVAASGTPDDRALYARNQGPWCEDSDEALCGTLASLPKRELGTYLWPEGMTDAEFAGLAQEPAAKELMSPFTLVRQGEGGFKAVPYVQDPLFAPLIKELAAHLRAAATHTGEPTLKKFLEARAAALESPEAFPYDASDYDWIALDGKWEVTVGPYETYKDPRQVKARFEMFFGPVDEAVTAQLAPFRANLQAFEEKVADLVGRDLYQVRKLDPRIVVRAIDCWYAAGDGRNPQGAIAAFHLPNRGVSVEEGLYKKVMLVNHMKSFQPIMQARAELILAQELRQYVTGDADVLNTTFHEFCHGFGAHDEYAITLRDGTTTTVHGALKEYTSLLEEEKADVLGLWLVADQVKSGAITAEQARARYASHVMHLFGLLQYAFKGTYPQMAAIELGWYLEHGGLKLDADGTWSLDFEKMPAAVEGLAKSVATLQLSGDYDATREFVARYVTRLPDGGVEPAALLKAPLADVSARFKSKQIKSISINYTIEGLD
jgi:hypothetical protein